MAEDIKVVQKEVKVHELVIRWIPATGQMQFQSSLSDPVAQLGLLEMVKMAMLEQKIQAATGTGPSLIVPGRFQS